MTVLESFWVRTPYGHVWVEGESFGDPQTGEPDRETLYWELYDDSGEHIERTHLGYMGNSAYTKREYLVKDVVKYIEKHSLQYHLHFYTVEDAAPNL